MSKEQKILQLLKQNNGILRISDIRYAGINKYHIYKLLKKGKITRIKPGLFRESEFDSCNIYHQLNKIIPSGVLCLYSAWYYHELSTYIPHEQHLAVWKNSKITLPEYPLIKLWYWTKAPLETGIIEGDFKIYDLEKSVCDALRYRNKIGKDLLNQIFKSYLERKDKNLDKLSNYAKLFKIDKVLKNYLEILL